MSSFRILSIDAGGIRGIYTAVIIERIVKEVPDLLDQTVFFAGTSTGAMLAMGLAYGIPPVETIELFRAYAKEVLERSFVIKVGQVLGAKYDIFNLRKILTPYFGAATLDEYLANRNKFVLVPTFDLDALIDDVRTWKPKFFHNFPGPDSDAGEMVVDVILRSSAIPVYFPSYQGYIGGSVVARNPAMAALAQALNEESGKQQVEDIRLLSFGTGYFPRYVGSREQDWGLGRWSWPLISLMLDGEMGVNHYQCMQILGPERYHRLAPILSKPFGLDDTKAIPFLIRFAQEVDIGPTVEWINQKFLDQDPNLGSSLETEPEAPDSMGIKIHRSEFVRPLSD
jgi:hypothetical protein